jgi:hypothetical protein
MLKVFRTLVIALLVTVGLIAITGTLWFVVEGISARRTPGRLETAVARRLRTVAIPSAARRLQKPVPVSPDAILFIRNLPDISAEELFQMQQLKSEEFG